MTAFSSFLSPGRRAIGSLALALALVACKPAAAPLDAEADPIARQFYEEIRTGGDLDTDPHLAHELKNPTTEDQINQPFVGVATCWNEAAPCNIALNRQAQSVKVGVNESRCSLDPNEVG